MSSYPSYKIADVRWLDKTPELWQVKPLFAVLRENKLANRGNQEDNVLSLSYGRIIRRDLSQNFGLLPDSFETYQIVNPGDIVLRLTDLQNDKKSLRVGLVKEQGIITSAYTCLVSTPEILPKYAYYLLHAYDLMKVFYNEGAGVRQSMNFRDLRRMPVLIPSLPEQKTIVDFLDRKTAQIDMLIAKKQRQIELLQEQRIAIINQAVSKGLDPSTTMKASKIVWLGGIPAHWDCGQLKRKLLSNDGGVWGDEIYDDSGEGSIVLRSTEITIDGKWNINNPARRKLIDSEIEKSTLKAGDLLITKSSGSESHIGKTALVTLDVEQLDACFSNFMQRIRPHQDMDSRFLYYFMNSRLAREQFNYFSTTTTGLANLNSGIINNLLAPFPPLFEQKTIADFLDWKTTQIDKYKAIAQESLDTIQEYRTALITEAVTGKIDVRGEV